MAKLEYDPSELPNEPSVLGDWFESVNKEIEVVLARFVAKHPWVAYVFAVVLSIIVIVGVYAGRTRSWRRWTRAPPGPLLTWPLVAENLEFFQSPCRFMYKR